MGRLIEANTKRVFIPGSSCLVGRGTASQLVLSNAWVSGQHATLRWTGARWELRDLGSKNGTWVRGKRIEPGTWVELNAGDTVGFGRAEEPWTLAEDAPPSAMAWLGEQALEAEDGLLALPSAGDPLVCVYRSEAGMWVAETHKGIEHVRDGHRLDIQGKTYVLDLPQVVAATRDMRTATLASCGLTFHVSRDYEHIEVDVRGPGREVRLPHRAHHELLLYLAQARLEDASNAKLPAEEHGWRYQDDVARQLRIPPSHFNMTIYRARQQFRGGGFDDANALLERRRGSGQIRIGLSNLTLNQL